MVRFVPPAPLDAATLGGAFLMLCASNRCHSIADRFCSPRLYPPAHLRISIPPRCVDLLSSSRPFNSHASHRSSTPLRISANRLIALALATLCKAVQCRCISRPYRSISKRFRSTSLLSSSFALLGESSPFLAFPLLCPSVRRRSVARQRCSRRSHSGASLR